MSDVLHFHGHHRYRCNCEEMSCPTCGGELYMCTRCGGAEGSLPTHCPGEQLSAVTLDKIFEGEIDYQVPMGWVEKRKNAS